MNDDVPPPGDGSDRSAPGGADPLAGTTTTAEPAPQGGQWPRRWPVKKVRRGRKLFGVCGGLARASNVDIKLVRILMVLAGIAGWGVPVYIVLAIVLPDETVEHPALPLPSEQQLAARIGLGVAAVIVLGDLVDGWPVGDDGSGLGLALILIGGAVLWTRRRHLGPVGDPAPLWPEPDPVNQVTDVPPPWMGPIGAAPLGAGIDWRSTGRDLVRLVGAFIAIGTAFALVGGSILVATGTVDMRAPLLPFGIGALGLVGLLVSVVKKGRLAGMVVSGGVLVLAAMLAIGLTTLPRGTGDKVYVYAAGEPIPRRIQHGAGSVLVDLSKATIPQREMLGVSLGAGRLTVVLPPTTTAVVTVDVGAGQADVLGVVQSGPDFTVNRTFNGSEDAPTIRLHLEVGLGSVIVRRTDGASAETRCEVPERREHEEGNPIRCERPGALSDGPMVCNVSVLHTDRSRVEGFCAETDAVLDGIGPLEDGVLRCSFKPGSEQSSSCTRLTPKGVEKRSALTGPPTTATATPFGSTQVTCTLDENNQPKDCVPSAATTSTPPSTVVCTRTENQLVCP